MNRRDFFKFLSVGVLVGILPASVLKEEKTLVEQTDYNVLLMQLHDKGAISTRALFNEMGLDYEEELERMRHEHFWAGL